MSLIIRSKADASMYYMCLRKVRLDLKELYNDFEVTKEPKKRSVIEWDIRRIKNLEYELLEALNHFFQTNGMSLII